MTPQDLAEKLTGREYTQEITKAEAAEAKAHGLVVVFGASDDLVEFRGAIYDEIGAYGGNICMVDDQGLLPDWQSLVDDGAREDDCRSYFQRKGSARPIKALWAAEGDLSWTFRTDIPHATFEIVEDGAPYCRGIVFRLLDCKAPQGAAS